MIRLLIDEALPGVRNMAVDEALMRSASTGNAAGVTLRFYRWEPGCLSFGRNQEARGAYDPDAAADRGIDIVRRPTGGRAVYHHRELTYSVTAPAGTWGSLELRSTARWRPGCASWACRRPVPVTVPISPATVAPPLDPRREPASEIPCRAR